MYIYKFDRSNFSYKKIISIVSVSMPIIVIVGSHLYLGERPIDYIGLRAILDAGYSLLLLIIVSVASLGVGAVVIYRFDVPGIEDLEVGLISIAIGFGVVAYGVLFIGLLGFLKPAALWIWLGVVCCVSGYKWRIWAQLLSKAENARVIFWRLDIFKKTILVISISILILIFIQALTPPWGYDGLLYHLEVPRQIINYGKIIDSPEHWLMYFPLTIEMLFTLGMGLGSDVFSKLIHVLYGVILVISTHAFGKRYLGSLGAWISIGVLIGIPVLPLWSGWAYVDMGLAVYTFLSAYAAFRWGESRNPKWLVISGILMGFALGIKYTSLGAAVSIGMLVIWFSRGHNWQNVLKNAFYYGGIALFVGSPWYIKNTLWTGNPVYPLLGGVLGWSPHHMKIWMSFVQGFGTGNTIWDYILLPISLYCQHDRFATAGSIDMPSILFPLIFFYPFTQRNRILNGVAILCIVQFSFWAIGSQVNRYLVPVYPLLSLLTSHVIVFFSERLKIRKLAYIFSRGLVLGVLITSLLLGIVFFIAINPLRVVFGTESKDGFLRRVLEEYSVIDFVNSELSEDARVLMMWDGRGYYCENRCIPDIDHSRWTDLVMQGNGNITSVTKLLRNMGVSYLLYSTEDADYILQHDPLNYQKDAQEFFFESYRSICTKEIYSDALTSLYEITCYDEYSLSH